MEIITTMYVKQYIKGVYTLYPTEAQYVGIWDTAQVFDFVRKPQYSPKEDIDLMMLSKKLFFFSYCHHYGPMQSDNYKLGLITLKAFKDKELCPVGLLQQYLLTTKNLWTNSSCLLQ